MAKLTSPEVNISFVEKGASAIQRNERGIVALVVKDAVTGGPFTVYSVADIPEGMTDANKKSVKDALIGYQVAPKKVIVYCMNPAAEKLEAEYTKMMGYFGRTKFNWMAIPTVETDGKTQDVASWIKSLRSTEKLMRKAVLPNSASDSEGVANVTSSIFTADGTEITPENCCARVAGIICGTPIRISATYAPILEAADCTRLSNEDADKKVGNGELVFIWDGEKVKLNRAVNSFTTTTDTKGDSFKKIKLVEIMDMIYEDIKSTAQDSYIGKFDNGYDNKCLLITAVNAYFKELIRTHLLASGTCEIDVDAQRNYLQSQGEKVEEMSDQDIKEAETGSKVFLMAHIKILDAMEDINLDINI